MNNRNLLISMAQALSPLLNRIVFVGGSVIELLVDDAASTTIRVTRDVDVIVGIATRADYYALIDELKNLQFKEPMPDSDEPLPICRMQYRDMLLDIMPADASILGFTNKWYAPALVNPQMVQLAPGINIKVIDVPYFIATKLEAFFQRGKGDLLSSHDMEDIITVYNGRNDIVAEIQKADIDVKSYLRVEFNKLIAMKGFRLDCLSGHLVGEPPKRADVVYKRIAESIA